jgi:serine/threonine protein phosphatase PrpC
MEQPVMAYSEKNKLGCEENGSSEDLMISTIMMAGAQATQGLRSSMEDTHSVRLWSKIRKEDSGADTGDEERPLKRQRTEDKLLEPSALDSPLTSVLAGSDGDEPNKPAEELRVSFFTVCDGHGGVQAPIL